jgi:hypothetical protein
MKHLNSLFLATTSLLAAASIVTATHAEEDHLDIWVSASGGSLFTGGFDHTTETVVTESLRVFEGEFGIDPSFPFSGDEPGISSDLVGATLTFNLLQGLGAWNGGGFDVATTTLLASYGGQDALSSTGGSFSFLVSEDLDLHPEFTMLGAGGSDPANGIYLASVTFSSAGLADSETMWIVFNLGMDEAEHAAATEWVEANLVPAPGALALLALAGAMRRRVR